MTWRVAILAFTIMLAGATAPVIRDAVGGRAGYRVMGVAMAVVIVVGVVSAYVGTRHAPVGAVEPGAGSPARPAADRRRRPRLPAAADHVRRPGAGDRLHARRRRLPRQRRARQARAPATILFVCFVGPALLLTPAWAASGARIGKKQRLPASPRSILAAGALLAVLGAVGAVGRRLRRDGAWSASGTPAARCSRWRCCPTRRPSTPAAPGRDRAGVYTGVWTAGETLGLALGPGALRAGAGARRLPVQSTAGDVAQPDSALTAITLGFSVLPAPLILLSLVWLAPLLARRRRGRRGTDGAAA